MYKFKIYMWQYIKKVKMFKEIIEENKDRLKDYMNVYIFEDYNEMYDYVDKSTKIKQIRNYQGMTYSYKRGLLETDDEKGYKDKLIGYFKCHGNIYLCDKGQELTYNVISHEVCHAIIQYFDNHLLKYNPICKQNEKATKADLNEELFCYMTGFLNNQILVNLK